MERMKRIVSLLLCAVMVIGFLPVSVFAAESDAALTASLNEAKEYIHSITVDNASNDPETVVKNFKTHFTWDNEKREDEKKYLFDWSYYNGVVFEGIEYLYEVTGEQRYKDYVMEYMSSLIASGGTWAKCTNSGYTSMECAGYNANHGADCYKTASLLLDAYEMSGDTRYLTIANKLYADLNTAAANSTYNLSKCGNNFRHTWSSDPSPDLWLDGLYMILPFRAEYAKYTGDTAELELIVDRLQWVSDNMYNSSRKLFYHAADSATSNSGSYWLRAIGWYAAAIVDVMDSMEGDNLETMKVQLKKLVDGMKACQNASNGMWLNNMAASQSDSNPYETSGTALVCYAVMKAVNNGWLDESYADMAILAFKGICNEKLSNNNLTDICFKGAPGSANIEFKDNEGKGLGPFIMFYAEMLEYVNKSKEPEETTPPTVPTEPTVPETSAPVETEPVVLEYMIHEQTGVRVDYHGITGLTVNVIPAEDVQALVADVLTGTLVAYDITVKNFTEGSTAAVTVAIPEGVNADNFAVFYVPTEGDLERMEGEAAEDGTTYTFYTTHFSTYVGGVLYDNAEVDGSNEVTGTGSIAGGYTYTLDTDGVDYGSSNKYLIVGQNNAYALTANGSNTGVASVTIANNTITLDTNEYEWYFATGLTNTGSSTYNSFITQNGETWLYHTNSSMYVGNGADAHRGYWRVESQGNGNYRIGDEDYYTWRLYYYNGKFTVRPDSNTYVRLFKLTDTVEGAVVTFTASPKSSTVNTGKTQAVTYEITLGDGTTVTSADIDWSTSNASVATVENGVITGVDDGTATITATLSAVNGTALVNPIVLEIPVTVSSREVVSAMVTTPSGSVYVGSGDEALTGGKITLTYNDDTQETIDITLGMLNGTIDRNTTGTYSNLTVMYNGNPVANANGMTNSFVLTVLPKPDANYPEYPNPGSVFVDKYISDYTHFQNAGVAQVELTASGLPTISGVDVILVTDFSNSMARPTTDTNNDGTINDEDCPTDFTQTKMYDLVQSIDRFANNFLTGGDAEIRNTISMVTFGGYDAEHTKTKFSDLTDVTRTLFLGYDEAEDVQNVVDQIRLLKDSSYSNGGFKLSFDGGVTYNGNYGNTNYDYAFMETYNAVNALKQKYQDENGIAYEDSGRSIYILFMTDGAPTNYDGVYFNGKNYNNTSRPDINATWNAAVGSTVESNYQLGPSNGSQYDNGAWYEYIAGGEYNKTTQTIPGNAHYWATQVYNMDGVENMFSIGFDTAHGGFSSMQFTEDANYPLNKVLEKMVEGQTLKVYDAEDSEELKKIYADLATELKLAATNARFIDQMGDDFDLQMANVTYKPQVSDTAITLTNTITVSTYDIYTADDGVAENLIGKRKGNATVIEKVTFNANGTEAYSDKLSGNILVDGVICAKNFWYNTTPGTKTITLAEGKTYELPAETFYWNIGTISNKEFVLSYPVYLEGAREGTAAAGSYDTNNYADLHYTNWLNNEAVKKTESPVLAWKSALVNFGFYLVDDFGNPVVNRATGQTGSFEDAIKVTPKIFYDMIELNSNENVIEIAVSDHLPYGYEIFDTMAAYKITVDSGNAQSGWEITCNPALTNMLDEQIRSTYVTDYSGNAYTNLDSADLENHGTIDYTSTTVWFAVRYSLSTVPDVVVIDYGLPVDIDVLTNDMLGDAATLVGIGSTANKPVGSEKQFTVTHSADFGSSFASAAISDDELRAGDIQIQNVKAGEIYPRVRYSPNSMEMPTFDKFTYEVAYKDARDDSILYFYGDVTVVPATIIYYEDDFLTYESFHVDTTTYELSPYGKEEKSLWNPVGTAIEGATQSEDRPGEYYFEGLDANNIYGYDPTYGNLSTYSLGSAMQATVDAENAAHATFTFYGTGFDVVSLTDCDAGVIVVDVYQIDKDGNETKYLSHVVDNYYGYVLNHYMQTYTYTEEEGWIITDQEICTEADYEAGNQVIPTEPGTKGQTVVVYKRIYEIDTNARDNALYQVPVMKVVDMPYGHYKAVIRATFKSLMYHDQNNSSRSYNFTLDAIRIYDPANDGINDNSGVIEYAYTKDGEGWPVFFELRNQLLGAKSFDNVAGDKVNGAVFIDGNSSVDDDYIMTDYLNFGPNNEVYLAKDQAVAFKLDLTGFDRNGKSIVEDVHIALKTENGADTTYEIYYLDENGNRTDPRVFQLDTATDRYYKLPNYDKGVLVILNTGSGLLSITNLKITFNADPYGVVAGEDEELEIPMTITEGERDMAVMSLRMRAMAPVVPDETIPEEPVPEETVPEETEPEETVPEKFEPEFCSLEMNKTSAKAGQKINVNVTTSDDVAYITVNGMEVSGRMKGGVKTFSLKVVMSDEPEMEIRVVAYSADGIASDPITGVVGQKGKKK